MKRTYWVAAAFYLLIVFEFFYMASPFAIYFYSVYGPGLDILHRIPGAGGLIGFFLPHVVVETSSTLVNLHSAIGAALAVFGFAAFCVGAGQVYYHKLTRKGAVTGGIYNTIRHPQYTSFVLCSFGLLVLWPRYLALVMFVTVVFAYFFLARAEERECEEKFGRSYTDYMDRTHMFLPFRMPLMERLPGLPRLPRSRIGRVLSITALYILTVLVSLGLARGLQTLALDSLYALYSKDAAYISVSKLGSEEMERLAGIALADERVRTKLDNAREGAQTRFLNYVAPAGWYISEIPMNVVEGDPNHFLRSDDYDEDIYKIIFTRADIRTDRGVEGEALLLNTVGSRPIVEVWIDLFRGKVVDLKEPPAAVRYGKIPVPVY